MTQFYNCKVPSLFRSGRNKRRVADDLSEELQCGLSNSQRAVRVGRHFVSTATTAVSPTIIHTEERTVTHAPYMRTYENVPAFLYRPVTWPLTV